MSMQRPRDLIYQAPGPVVNQFMASNAFFRGITGPLGSGKSSACVAELLRRANQQEKSHDGIRYTRAAVIRNSYPELKTTTIKTWFQWMPQEFGRFTQDSPILHHVKAGDLDLEVLFLALDREEDVKKLLSLELSFAWVNEYREIQKAIIDALTGRVGRFPSTNMGGCTWSGIFADTNPPDDQHWIYQLAEENTPEGWEFFNQPSGTSKEAENLENLPKDYYKRISAGKDPDWIRVYVHGNYGFVNEGKSVYTNFKDSVHVASEVIEPNSAFPILIGCDLGLTPAATLAQKLPDGRWIIFDEVISDSCGLIRFSETLKQYISTTYPEFKVEHGWCDPAGNQRAFSDERTGLEVLRTFTGWKWHPAQTNDFTPRREVVVSTLNRMVDGKPGLLVSPKCKTLRKAMNGGYHFKFVKTGNGAQLHEQPNKNQYSHVAESLQYLMLGGGEYSTMLMKDNKKRTTPKIAEDVEYDFFRQRF